MRYLIGVGTYAAFDDSIGLRIAEAVADRGLDRTFRAIDLGGNLIDVVHYLGPDTAEVLFIDSARMGRMPGDHAFFTTDEVTSRKRLAGFSTHEDDLLKVLDLASRISGVLPPITILGIEPETVTDAIGLSGTLADRMEEYIALAVGFFERDDA